MSTGLYTITTRATGTVLTSSIYNSDHQNHVNNQNPEMTGAYSDNVSQMQVQTDPGGLGTESLAPSLAGELERLRFQIAAITGNTFWYEAPNSNLSSIVVGPASSVNGRVVTFNGTSGKLLQDGGVLLSALAPLASPTFTGVPAAPTASPGTNTTQLATTAFVAAATTKPATTVQFLPADPTGIASTSYKMLGIGATVKFTPTLTGIIEVKINFTAFSAQTGLCNYKIKYGTGTPPANNAADTGTQLAGFCAVDFSSGLNDHMAPFIGLLTGATLATQLWFDIAINTTTGTIAAKQITAIIRELVY